MSRAQETAADTSAAAQNSGYYTNAQNSYANAQQDASNYESQLGSYAAANPYVAGGAYQTATNQQLTDTADASAKALGTTLQGQALRTGQNTSGGVAAAEQTSEANTRALGSEEAAATQSRLASGAQYGQNVLNATGTAEGQQAQLAGQQAGAGNSALGEEVNAAKTPSWTDEFGNALAGRLGGGKG
jgi:hypothetical protein